MINPEEIGYEFQKAYFLKEFKPISIFLHTHNTLISCLTN